MTTLCVPGLLLDGEWIPPIRQYGGPIPSLTEIIISASANIFPSYYVAHFDLTVGEDFDAQVPVDLVLVSKTLEAWYLIFVEPASSVDMESLLSRLETANGHSFGVREAGELVRKIGELSEDQARVLVHNNPSFVVVTDDPRHDWNSQLSSFRAEANIMIVEPFPYSNGYAIRINGDAPTEFDFNVIGRCVPHELMQNCLKVSWSRPSETPAPGNISLKYGNVETQWELVQASQTWQLQPMGPFPLESASSFEIVQLPEGTLSIRRSAD